MRMFLMRTVYFAFFVPDFSKVEDIPDQFVPAEDGTRLAYRQIGDISAEKALIFVPGSTMYGYYYIPFIKNLHDKDLYIRVIDLRGHGDSGGPRGDVPHKDSLIDDLHVHIGNIKSVSPEAFVYIAGHSMGAGICGKYLEKYGYNSVDGVVYIAPFFHYRQPGMKDAGYVDVNILKTFFGHDHVVTQVYHPAGNDPKLVRKYTKIMSKASMLSNYTTFRRNHGTQALYLIGKKDELFDWKTSPEIFKGRDGIRYVIINEATHLDILERSARHIREWIHASSGS
jgi:acylglycerol lipase